MVLTPNGRFELNTKICISFTNYHEEEWQPAWGVRTAIIGLQGFFPLKGQAALGVGSVEYPVSERKRLAQLSRDWVCPQCARSNLECLPDPDNASNDQLLHSHSTTSRANPIPVLHDPSPPSHQSSSETLETRPDTPDVSSQSSSSSTSHEVHPAILSEASSATTFIPLNRSPQRPPVLLDTAICVLLVLILALLCRRIL